MVDGKWIIACVGNANTMAVGWVNIVETDKVMVLIRVVRIVVKSRNKGTVFDSFRMLGCDVQGQSWG